MKRCNKCSVEKNLMEFPKHKKCIDGVQGICKNCCSKREKLWNQKNRDRKNKNTAKWRKCNKEKVAIIARKYKYDINEEQRQQMIITQNNKCAICKEEFIKTPHTDHYNDYEGNPVVRGLLCNNCNNGLGRFKDNKEYLRNAINYLENS
jgi:hypothetical protein